MIVSANVSYSHSGIRLRLVPPSAAPTARRALGWTEENPRPMSTQNYANHAKYVTGFHIVLFGILVLTLIGSVVNLYRSIDDHQRLYSAALIFVLTFCLLLLSFLSLIHISEPTRLGMIS